jgi:hypothetical protein
MRKWLKPNFLVLGHHLKSKLKSYLDFQWSTIWKLVRFSSAKIGLNNVILKNLFLYRWSILNRLNFTFENRTPKIWYSNVSSIQMVGIQMFPVFKYWINICPLLERFRMFNVRYSDPHCTSTKNLRKNIPRTVSIDRYFLATVTASSHWYSLAQTP